MSVKNIYFNLSIILLFSSVLSGCTTIVYGLAKNEQTKIERKKYLESAQNGDKVSQYFVGASYCCGYSQIFHTDKAVAWLCRSAKQGYSRAQYQLANIYAGNYNLQSTILMANDDYHLSATKAYGWFKVAEESGHAKAAEQAKRVRVNLSKEQLENANTIINHWQAIQCPTV